MRLGWHCGQKFWAWKVGTKMAAEVKEVQPHREERKEKKGKSETLDKKTAHFRGERNYRVKLYSVQCFADDCTIRGTETVRY